METVLKGGIIKVVLIALCAVSAVILGSCGDLDNGTWTPDGYSPIQLTENQWADGNIAASDGQQWFTFTAAASVQYIHINYGTLRNLYVQVYDSNGSSVGSDTNFDPSFSYVSKTLKSGQKYYIKVWPNVEGYRGFYQIGFSTSPLTAGTYGDFNYEIAVGITITGYTGTGDTVDIPPEINGKPVTAIGGSAFYNNQLISVIIPNSVTFIGNYAFSTNQLADVIIPDSVTIIGERAFYNNQLTNVIIPNSVAFIGDNAFFNNELISVTIGANVELSNNFSYPSFPGNFDTVYTTTNNKAAGTYTRISDSSSDWIKNAEGQ
jgi:hypothetical protein